jgi:hypothetical protein
MPDLGLTNDETYAIMWVGSHPYYKEAIYGTLKKG